MNLNFSTLSVYHGKPRLSLQPARKNSFTIINPMEINDTFLQTSSTNLKVSPPIGIFHFQNDTKCTSCDFFSEQSSRQIKERIPKCHWLWKSCQSAELGMVWQPSISIDGGKYVFTLH